MLCKSTYKLALTIGSSNLELLAEVSEIKFGLKRVREAASISKAGKEVQQGLENIGDGGSWRPGDSWVTPGHSPQRQSQHMCPCSSPCQHPTASICNRAATEGDERSQEVMVQLERIKETTEINQFQERGKNSYL